MTELPDEIWAYENDPPHSQMGARGWVTYKPNASTRFAEYTRKDLAQPAQGWRDIGEAKHDGTQYIGWVKSPAGEGYFCEVIFWRKPDNDDGYWTNGYYDKYEDDYRFEPTHFQDLPSPP